MKFILVAFIGFIVLALAERSPRIVGGHDAKPHEFPYMVYISIRNKYFCGGTIISKLFILTAAHCLYEKYGEKLTDFLIKAGSHNISAIEETEQIRHPAKIISHEEYVYNNLSTPDIGLIKLDYPLEFTDAIKSIDALPKKVLSPSSHGIIMGWGSTTSTSIPHNPQILQKAIVPILPNDVCGKAYEPKIKINIDNFLCTGPFPGKIGACGGDSGSPLVQIVLGYRTVIGISNFGIEPCDFARGPSVFARVSAYSDWIMKNMK